MSQSAAGGHISFIISFFLSSLFVFLLYHVKSRFFLGITSPDITLSLISKVQFSHSVVSNSLWPHGLEHARPPCPSPTPGACSNSCPLSWWCHPTILSSVIPFSSHLQSFPASGSFPNESVLCIRWPKYLTLSPITRDKSHAWSKPIPEPIRDFVCSSLLSLWVSQVVLVIKNSPAGDTGDAGDIGLIPGPERSTRVGNGSPLQYSCLENYVGRGAWQTTVHGPAKSWTWWSTAQQHSLLSTYFIDFLHWNGLRSLSLNQRPIIKQ